MCSNNAAFVITIATEMFIQYMAEQGHNVVKAERKPRRNIQYRDLSNAVARIDNLEFLVDVVPRTIPYKEVKAKKIREPNVTNGEGPVESGQMTLDGLKPMINGSNGFGHDGAQDEDDDDAATVADPNVQLEMENRAAPRMEPPILNGLPNSGSEDVEMR